MKNFKLFWQLSTNLIYIPIFRSPLKLKKHPKTMFKHPIRICVEMCDYVKLFIQMLGQSFFFLNKTKLFKYVLTLYCYVLVNTHTHRFFFSDWSTFINNYKKRMSSTYSIQSGCRKCAFALYWKYFQIFFIWVNLSKENGETCICIMRFFVAIGKHSRESRRDIIYEYYRLYFECIIQFKYISERFKKCNKIIVTNFNKVIIDLICLRHKFFAYRCNMYVAAKDVRLQLLFHFNVNIKSIYDLN